MKAWLVLEDGTCFPGRSFTGAGQATGEAIFNTGMTGYQEILTDPSYAGQLVCMTAPHIGNYGINPHDVESHSIWTHALIVKECCKIPSSWRSTESLPDYLLRHDVMGIEGVDTRALTRHLRLHGSMRAVLSTSGTPEELTEQARQLPSMEGQDLSAVVTCKAPYIWTDNGPKQAVLQTDGSYAWPGPGLGIVVYDFGVKWNILRLLAEQGLDLLVVPASFTMEQVAALTPQGIFLTNGPGDPAAMGSVVTEIAGLIGKYPLGGICLGHQLLGLALGGTTFKLKFGHHGLNHPVKDLATGHIEISSQNHGFCVDIAALSNAQVTHVNLNDGTVEGFCCTSERVIGVQHHPEACPGPHDSADFFARYSNLVKKYAQNQ